MSDGDVRQIAVEFKRRMGTGKDAPTTNGVDVLGWDFAFEVNEVARQQAERANLNLRFLRIPRDVMDKRAVDQGDIKFFELAALSVDVKTKRLRRFAVAERFRDPAGRRAGGRAHGGQALVAVDRLLGGGLGPRRQDVPQPVADVPDAQAAEAGSGGGPQLRGGRANTPSWSR